MIIDRFEGDFAVIEDNGKMLNVPRKELPDAAKEGSVLIKSGDSYEIDKTATQNRKASLQARFNALKKKA